MNTKLTWAQAADQTQQQVSLQCTSTVLMRSNGISLKQLQHYTTNKVMMDLVNLSQVSKTQAF